MDKLNFVRDGGRKLPPGFRFEPTEEEIVFQYLSRKTFSHPLPALVIPEIDVFSMDPWQLAGDSDSEEDMYFFSNAHGCDNESERVTPSGVWKANGSSKKIINSSKRMPIVGIKKSLVFYMRSSTKIVATNWIMHQYCIALPQQEQNNCLVRIGEWSLCRIFMKKGGRQVEDDDANSYSASSSSPNYDPTIFNEVSSST